MVKNARKQITETLIGWDGVTAHPHRFGGTEYRLGKREIGHIHGDTMVDIPFPTRVKKELVKSGEAENHHLLPKSGWISFHIRTSADLPQAISLFQKSYDIATRQKLRRKSHR